ncbi:MAG: tRNA 2-selenouridine(34) synthase MnmH [Bacteroidales bacterium]
MIEDVHAEVFIRLSNEQPLFDVRSPSEYAHGHIPGAINLPLFDDEERRKVGILYKNAGQEAAILEGLGFAGKKLQQLVKKARRFAPGRKILLHCWRGGMRSENMAWLLSLAGFEVTLLQGGYKAYRSYIRECWKRPAHLIVVSGKTGSGKTEILSLLEKQGHQVLNLESLAHHKGSAFGALGESTQPTSEQFENNLAALWLNFDLTKPVWMEDESRFIGKVNIPDPLFSQQQAALTLCLDIPRMQRIQRLERDYASFHPDILAESILKIEKRLGGQHAKTALTALYQNDISAAIEIVLQFYDKTYSFDLKKKNSSTIFHIHSDTGDASVNARTLLDTARQFLS